MHPYAFGIKPSVKESTSHPTENRLGRITIESRSVSDSNSEADLLPNQESDLLPNQINQSESQSTESRTKPENGHNTKRRKIANPEGLGQTEPPQGGSAKAEPP